MKTIWPAAALTLVVTGYFAWSSMGAAPKEKLHIDDCHRLADQVHALHGKGAVVSDDLLAVARQCAVTFGQNWAATGVENAVALRAEGAARVK